MRWSVGAAFIAVSGFAGVASAQIVTPMPGDLARTPQAIEIQISRTDAPARAAFALSPARLWPRALLAYTRAGLRVDVSDPAARRVETRGQVLWNELKGHRLSEYFECGRIFTGPIADRWRLLVNAQMAVMPGAAPDNSGLVVALAATATPTDGSASSTACSSTGKLEETVAAQVRRMVPTPTVTD